MFDVINGIFTTPSVEKCPSGWRYDSRFDRCTRGELPGDIPPYICNGQKVCPEGHSYNESLNLCISEESKQQVIPPSKRCPSGFTYQPKTDSCARSRCTDGYQFIEGGFHGGYFQSSKCIKVNPATVGPEEVCPECPECDDNKKYFVGGMVAILALGIIGFIKLS